MTAGPCFALSFDDAERQARIAVNFSRAAASYDDAAPLQREVANDLLARLPEIDPLHTLVDVGCGTGYLVSRLAARHDARAIGVDIAPGMLAEARHLHANLPIDWLTGCAEQLPLANHSADLIVSSLAVQWCDSLDRFLSQAARVIRPGGWLAFTTLCEGTLTELHRARMQVDSEQRGNTFLTEPELLISLDTPHWRLQELVLTTRKTHHATPHEALQALKRIGANTPTAPARSANGLSGRRRFARLTHALETFRESAGVPTSYRVATVLMQRRVDVKNEKCKDLKPQRRNDLKTEGD